MNNSPLHPRINLRCLLFGVLALGSTLGTSRADSLVTSYMAHLSPQDHVNSSGGSITTFDGIIRQDRANYHRFGKRDPADTGDSLFSSSSNREKLEDYLKNGGTPQSVRSEIVRGTPVVTVNVYRSDSGSMYATASIQGSFDPNPYPTPPNPNPSWIHPDGGSVDGLLTQYTTQLSEQDHYHSSGSRHTNWVAVVCQDRANYHRFGKRDPADASDSMFTTQSARDSLGTYLENGGTPQSVQAQIMSGNPVVTVSVYRSGTGQNYATVSTGQPQPFNPQPYNPGGGGQEGVPGGAGALITQFQAHLSQQDHFNSQGVALTDYRSIIRQDRVNYHKFGKRDPADTSDPMFASADERANLENYLAIGGTPAGLQAQIVSGAPVVTVSVLRAPGGQTYATASFPNPGPVGPEPDY